MSKETEWDIKLTLPELRDLSCILDIVERIGDYHGRKDYWDKHFKKIREQTEKAIMYLEEQ